MSPYSFAFYPPLFFLPSFLRPEHSFLPPFLSPSLSPPYLLPPPILVSNVIPILYLYLCLIGDSEASNPSSISLAGRLAVTSLVNLSAALESTVYGRHGQHGQGDLSKLLCSRVDVCLSMLLQRSPSARSYLFSEMQGGDDTVQNTVLNRSRIAEVWNFSVFWSKICLFKAYFNTHNHSSYRFLSKSFDTEFVPLFHHLYLHSFTATNTLSLPSSFLPSSFC